MRRNSACCMECAQRRSGTEKMDAGFVAKVVTRTLEDGAHIVALADHDPPSGNLQIDLRRQLSNRAAVELA